MAVDTAPDLSYLPKATTIPPAGSAAYYAWRRQQDQQAAAPVDALNRATTATANATTATAAPLSTAALTTAQNTAATTAPGYMSPTDQAASQLSLAQLAESTRASQAGEGLTAAQQAEQAKEFGTTSTLAQSKFDQEKADRAALLGSLNTLGIGTGTSRGPASSVPTGGVTPEGGGSMPDGSAASDPYSDPSSPESMAQTAALTSSKERGGERLAASLKGLQGIMAARGISGSGIEAANTRDLVGQNLGFQNDTERAILEGKATRSQALADAATTRTNQVQDRDFAAQQAANAQKIQALLATYGMTY